MQNCQFETLLVGILHFWHQICDQHPAKHTSKKKSSKSVPFLRKLEDLAKNICQKKFWWKKNFLGGVCQKIFFPNLSYKNIHQVGQNMTFSNFWKLFWNLWKKKQNNCNIFQNQKYHWLFPSEIFSIITPHSSKLWPPPSWFHPHSNLLPHSTPNDLLLCS